MTVNETPQIPPMLDEAAVNGLVEAINFVASAKDAMSDEIIARLAGTVSEGMALLDRLTRNEGLMRLLQVLDQPEVQQLMLCFGKTLGKVSQELSVSRPSKGGLMELLRLAKEPGMQESIQVLSLFGQHLNEALREMHRSGNKTHC